MTDIFYVSRLPGATELTPGQTPLIKPVINGKNKVMVHSLREIMIEILSSYAMNGNGAAEEMGEKRALTSMLSMASKILALKSAFLHLDLKTKEKLERVHSHTRYLQCKMTEIL